MYLHLGQNVIVRERDVLGIFDLEITSQSKRTRQFLAAAEKGGRAVTVSDDLPRSFIVTADKVYISPLSSATLQKRAQTGAFRGGEWR
ncbi:MAG: DUF370 domain-containing protein [Oscillospiraceae bacterium]|nr:DUF370 domain-containing protein [Oscillospiraceae bacterium]